MNWIAGFFARFRKGCRDKWNRAKCTHSDAGTRFRVQGYFKPPHKRRYRIWRRQECIGCGKGLSGWQLVGIDLRRNAAAKIMREYDRKGVKKEGGKERQQRQA